jgi:large subunit ribosomal protein L31
MKKGIHPEYHDVLIIMTDGASYKIKYTPRKKKPLWKLDMDTKSHAFWSAESSLNLIDSAGQKAKFKKRFF